MQLFRNNAIGGYQSRSVPAVGQLGDFILRSVSWAKSVTLSGGPSSVAEGQQVFATSLPEGYRWTPDDLKVRLLLIPVWWFSDLP